MSEEPQQKVLRRIKKSTSNILNEESFFVSKTTGKLAKYFDFTCFDSGGWRYVKVFLEEVFEEELQTILRFDKSPHNSSIALQIFVWGKNKKKPYAKPKLNFKDPNQQIPESLKKFVKKKIQ